MGSIKEAQPPIAALRCSHSRTPGGGACRWWASQPGPQPLGHESRNLLGGPLLAATLAVPAPVTLAATCRDDQNGQELLKRIFRSAPPMVCDADFLMGSIAMRRSPTS